MNIYEGSRSAVTEEVKVWSGTKSNLTLPETITFIRTLFWGIIPSDMIVHYD